MTTVKYSTLVLDPTEKKYYGTLRENLLHNFLEKYYRYTVMSTISCLISDIAIRCPFYVEYDDENNTLFVNVGDQILKYKFIWEERDNIELKRKYYRLIEIQ